MPADYWELTYTTTKGTTITHYVRADGDEPDWEAEMAKAKAALPEDNRAIRRWTKELVTR